MNNFESQTQAALTWKPYFFLYQHARKLRAVGKSMHDRITSWDRLKDCIASAAENSAPDIDRWEKLRDDKRVVLSLFVSYTAAIAHAKGVRQEQACKLAAMIHYCMFRWMNHRLRSSNKHLKGDDLKHQYIRDVQSTLLLSSSPGHAMTLLRQPKILDCWHYVRGGAEYVEPGLIFSFRTDLCQGDISIARSLILGEDE